MSRRFVVFGALLLSAVLWTDKAAAWRPDWRVGVHGHAFDHLDDMGQQAAVAAKSGATVLYADGLGSLGYLGLPSESELAQKAKAVAEYNEKARAAGIRIIFGYVCATSIVKIDDFDKNWSRAFKAQFSTRPSEWVQVGRDGKPLTSWYGTNYAPACMNNPDWNTYEAFMVAQQLKCGHDGIFFDNPTVHQQGCYCKYCMGKFAGFLTAHKIGVTDFSIPKLRQLTERYPELFRLFRSTIASSFISEMRHRADQVNLDALFTCNGSLNSPDSLFSQCRTLGYNIRELSKVEDLVVVEDMVSQPRALPGGRTVEYGPTFQLLSAISELKPVVAVELADSDYHTPPHLVQLAIAEATAHGAYHLWWPIWPEAQRDKLAYAVFGQMDLLRRNYTLLRDTEPRTDAILFFPFRQWLQTDKCRTAELAAALTKSNIQYKVLSEDDFAFKIDLAAAKAGLPVKRQQLPLSLKRITATTNAPAPVARRSIPLPTLLVESMDVLDDKEQDAVMRYQQAGGNVVAADRDDWWGILNRTMNRSVWVDAPPAVRAIVRDRPRRTVVHVYNLNIEKVSSYEDTVHPASTVKMKVFVRFDPKSVTAVSTYRAISGRLKFTKIPVPNGNIVEFSVSTVPVSMLVSIE